MPTNNFLTFASASGANVWSDLTFAGSSQQQTGIQKGIVPSGLMNKAYRQGAAGSAVMGQIITAYGLVDAVDDGNIPGLAATYRTALAAMLAGAAFAIDTSTTANVITAALDPAPPTLATFRSVFIRVANTNTGAATLALNTLGAKNIVKKSGAALVAGDIQGGQIVHLVYDLPSGQWVLAGLSVSDISALIAATFNSKRIFGGRFQVYNSPGTYTLQLPSDASTFGLDLWGAGGGGGGATGNGTTAAASGGGGGDYEGGAFLCQAGSSLTITVGAGGSGGAIAGNGGNGGLSSLTYTNQSGNAVTIVANGGAGAGGANGSASNNPGAGGTGTGGLDQRPGVTGGFPYQVYNGSFIGGSGGTSYTSSVTPPNNGFTGNTGAFPGGGGSGSAGNNQTGNGSLGGPGAGGKCIIRY